VPNGAEAVGKAIPSLSEAGKEEDDLEELRRAA